MQTTHLATTDEDKYRLCLTTTGCFVTDAVSDSYAVIAPEQNHSDMWLKLNNK